MKHVDTENVHGVLIDNNNDYVIVDDGKITITDDGFVTFYRRGKRVVVNQDYVKAIFEN